MISFTLAMAAGVMVRGAFLTSGVDGVVGMAFSPRIYRASIAKPRPRMSRGAVTFSRASCSVFFDAPETPVVAKSTVDEGSGIRVALIQLNHRRNIFRRTSGIMPIMRTIRFVRARAKERPEHI